MKTKSNTIFLLVLLFLIQCAEKEGTHLNIKKIELMKITEMGKGELIQPGLPAFSFNYMAILDSILLVSNTKGNFPFYTFNLNNFESKPIGAWGNGPKEFKENFPAIVSASQNYFYIYSPLQSRLIKFKEFSQSIEINLADQLPSLGMFYVYNDSSAVLAGSGMSMKQTEKYGEGFQMRISTDTVQIMSNGLKFGNKRLITQMENIKSNPILSNGTFLWKNENLYWFSFYSSLMVCFDKKGDVINSTFGVRKISFPEAKIRNVGNGTITADPEKMTQGYISISSDEKYLYALFSGNEITEKMIFASRRGELSNPINLGEGKWIDVFELKTLKYQFSFELPFWASGIIIHKNYFIVSETGESPVLTVYDKRI